MIEGIQKTCDYACDYFKQPNLADFALVQFGLDSVVSDSTINCVPQLLAQWNVWAVKRADGFDLK